MTTLRAFTNLYCARCDQVSLHRYDICVPCEEQARRDARPALRAERERREARGLLSSVVVDAKERP